MAEFTELVELMDGVSAKLGELSAMAGELAAAIREMADEPDPMPPVVVLTATEVTDSSVTISWTSNVVDLLSWRVSRDGTDSSGTGAWTTVLPASARTHKFNLLRANTAYRFTLAGSATASAVPVTTVDVTTKPTTGTPPPTGGEGTSAATRLGWGEPHEISDEFEYEGRPNPAKWILPGPGGWDGHNGNGRRMPENVFVKDGVMTLRGDANGNTGWVRQNLHTQYGRWEIRSRSRNTGASGGLYHPLHLIWPSSERWPEDGELDWLEYTNPDAKQASAWLHYPHRSGIPIQQEGPFSKNCDMTQWHNFAVEWSSTGVRSWIDAEPWYEVKDGGGPSGRKNIQAMPRGALTIQLDNFTGDGGLRPAVFEIAWARFYPIK